jgi:hypothetical protein
MKRKQSKRGQQPQGRRQPLKGRRFSAEQRGEALRMIRSGLKRKEVARLIKTTVESLRRRSKGTGEEGPPAAATPARPAHILSTTVAGQRDEAAEAAPAPPVVGLAPLEVEAILALKKEHPSMGPAQIRAQLKRFRGWRVSVKAIGRVLVRAGYRLVRKQGRPGRRRTQLHHPVSHPRPRPVMGEA